MKLILLFPLFFVLLLAAIIADVIGYPIASKYLAMISILWFLYTYALPVVIIDNWSNKETRLKALISGIFYIGLPTWLVLWALITGRVENF